MKRLLLILLIISSVIFSNAQISPKFLAIVNDSAELWSNREENPLLTSIAELQKILPELSEVEQAIAHSLIAGNLISYAQNNQWKILERTNLAEELSDTNDIAVWTLPQIVGKALSHVNLSLQNHELLKKQSINNFKSILTKSYNFDEIERPTLFDLLAFRAIDIFSNNFVNLTKVKEDFKFDKPIYFADSKDFTNAKINGKDQLDFKLQSLRLFQWLLITHLDDDNVKALINADIARLDYVHQYYKGKNSDSLYLDALNNLIKKFKENKDIDVAFVKLMQYYNYRNQKLAFEYAEAFLKDFPASNHINFTKNLITDIKSNTISVNLKDVLLPNKNTTFNVSSANIETLYFSIYKVPQKLLEESVNSIRYNIDKIATKENLIKTWTEILPNYGDYLSHDTALNLPALPFGFYVLISSNAQKTVKEKTLSVYNFFTVSNLCFYKNISNTDSIIGFVLNRETGKYLPDVEVKIYSQNYEYSQKGYVKKFISSVKTDKNGKFFFPNTTNAHDMLIDLFSDKDALRNNHFYVYNYSNSEKNSPKPIINTYFFTDRAIYRPGDIVYFKAIVMEKIGDSLRILQDFKDEITLKNANGQELSKLSLRTNDFGTYSGTFILPKNTLNGNFSLYSIHGTKYFNVEEYKRPKFELAVNPITENYNLGDEIAVSGSVCSYSGFCLQDAKVKYSVKRTVKMPYRFYFFIMPRNFSNQAVADGEITTDATGAFNFSFLSEKEIGNENSKFFIYDYVIEIEATSQSGETQSIVQHLRLSEVNLDIEVDINSVLYQNDTNTMRVTAKNLADVDVEKEGKITVYHNDIKDKAIFEINFNTKTDNPIFLAQLDKQKVGKYLFVVEITDDNGNLVSDTVRVLLLSKNSGKNAVEEPFYAYCPKDNFQPNDVARIIVGSAEKEFFARILVYDDKYNILSDKIEKFSKEQKTFDFKISEKHRGNIFAQVIAVKNNKTHREKFTFYVPYLNKNLKINVETFRSKLSPNQQETWTFVIKDLENKGVKSEFLASMYDASLDKFAKDYWSLSLYPQKYASSVFDFNDDFSPSHSTSHTYPNVKYFDVVYTTYPAINYNIWDSHVEAMVFRIVESSEMMKSGNKSGLVRDAIDAKPEADYAAISEMQVNDDDAREDKTTNESATTDFLRKNLNETAFFFPHLNSDEDGNVKFSFLSPESLTKWRFRALAHTKDLQIGTIELSANTEKELMVMPNLPRFLREGDKIKLSSSLINLTNEKIAGEAKWQIFDFQTNKILNTENTQEFILQGKEQSIFSEVFMVPDIQTLLKIRVLAESTEHKDGEENILPILSKRINFTDALPFILKEKATLNFDLSKYYKKSDSKKLNFVKLEIMTNPIWTAVLSLPELDKQSYNNSISIISKLYSDVLAKNILENNPEIEKTITVWREKYPENLVSNLEKNEDVKNILLEESPWVLDAKNETEQRQKIVAYFDKNSLENQLTTNFDKIKTYQKSDGGFTWCDGGKPSRYVTQIVVENLSKIIEINPNYISKITPILKKALQYLDDEFVKDYDFKIKNFKKIDIVNQTDIQYLVFREKQTNILPLGLKVKNIIAEYSTLLKKDFKNYGKYMQAYIATYFLENGEAKTGNLIIENLKILALHDKDGGMYWRKEGSFYWYDNQIDAQIALIRAFELAGDEQSLLQMKQWLLSTKRSTQWNNPKTSVEAITALLGKNSVESREEESISLTLNGESINVSGNDKPFFTKTILAENLKKEGKISVKNNRENLIWGGIYWNFDDEISKSEATDNPLSIKKMLYVKMNGERGKELTKADLIKVGDHLTVRMEIRVDKDMDFVSVKDLRAASFEPVDVVSGYTYQSGLWFYKETKDVSTQFFFDRINKGTYVLEYDVVATFAGNFTDGFATIQCVYAPEYTSRTIAGKIEIYE